MGISLFTPFKPMLADNPNINQIERLMKHEPFYIEVKYDGERMMAHRDTAATYKFFSRNSHDFTQDFGARPNAGKFSYYIEKALSPCVTSVILDGEICPYNKKLQVLVQKGEKMNIRQLKDDDSTFQQCLYIYDIVYYNGKVLTNMPLKQRLEVLKEVVPEEIPGK